VSQAWKRRKKGFIGEHCRFCSKQLDLTPSLGKKTIDRELKRLRAVSVAGFDAQCRVLCSEPFPMWFEVQARLEEIRASLCAIHGCEMRE
jgi:hypothetical protein